MDWLFERVRAEIDVIKRAPMVAVIVFALGLTLAGSSASYLYQRQLSEAQQAAVSAQASRDLWHDRYDQATTPGKQPGVRRPDAAVVPTPEISWPRTGLLAAAMLGALLLLMFVVSLGNRRGTREAPKIAQSEAEPEEVLRLQNRIAGLERALAEKEVPPERLMTASRPEPLPPPFGPPTLSSREQRGQPGARGVPLLQRAYLHGRQGESPARPHLAVVEVTTELRGPADRRTEALATIVVRNETNSPLDVCSVVVESILVGGDTTPIDRFMRNGPEKATTFQLGEGQAKSIIFLHRQVGVAPERPFFLILANDFGVAQDFPLGDFKTYDLNINLASYAGVVTRAVIEVTLGEYEDVKASLIGQASWRQPPPSTATGKQP